MVTIEQFKKGIANYLDAEVMPLFDTNGWQKVLIGAAASMGLQRLGENIKSNPLMSTIGVVKDGKVDVETAAQEIKKQMTDDGFSINIQKMNLKMSKKDIDTLCKYITEA